MRIVLATIGFAALFAAGAGLAAWSASGSGGAGSSALTVPAGNAPTARASGSDVVVVWNATTVGNGGTATGYVLARYDATTGALAAIGASCNGTLTATSCTEHNVPVGSWTYTDTPLLVGWTGSPSAHSNTVTVAPPPPPPVARVSKKITTTDATTTDATTTATTDESTTTDATTTTDQSTTTDGTTTDGATTTGDATTDSTTTDASTTVDTTTTDATTTDSTTTGP